MSIGDKLKNLRLKAKITLSEQSKSIGVSMNTIYRWENNITIPRYNNLEMLADFFSISLEWLLIENTPEETTMVIGSVEQQLLETFVTLPENDKYRVLGYIECLRMESARHNHGDNQEANTTL